MSAREGARSWQRLLQSRAELIPLAVAIGVFGVVALLVAPWGNFPLNDDWAFARVVKLFLTTGRVVIDTGVAPALVGQTIAAVAFSKVFGFSHLGLRLLTMLTAIATLFALHSLLSRAKVTPRVKTAALVTVAVNPLFINLAFSFMSECYGYALAIIATAVWFRSVRYSRQSGPVIGIGMSVLVGFLMGGSFWIRQYCILAYPAVLGATAIRLLLARDWRRIWSSLPAVVLGSVVFVATIAGYFSWAKQSGNFNPNFEGPLSQLWHFRLLDWQLSLGLHLIYLTAYLLPLLVLWPRSLQSRLGTAGTAAVCVAFAFATHSLLQFVAPDNASSLGLHRVFPFESNVIHNQGLGALTLTDTFFFERDKYPVIAKETWELIGLAIMAASALWALPIGTLGQLRRTSPQRVELVTFGILFSLLSLAAVVQAYGVGGFDRYALPLLFGMTLSVATLLAVASERRDFRTGLIFEGLLRKLGPGLFAAALLPLAFFTVAGMHDYFRWNDARWHLVKRALALGAPSTTIDGGYEVNGWLSLDALRNGSTPPEACIGSCTCAANNGLWSCLDDSYRVWVSTASDYEELASETPNYWLGKSRTIYLSRRRH